MNIPESLRRRVELCARYFASLTQGNCWKPMYVLTEQWNVRTLGLEASLVKCSRRRRNYLPPSVLALHASHPNPLKGRSRPKPPPNGNSFPNPRPQTLLRLPPKPHPLPTLPLLPPHPPTHLLLHLLLPLRFLPRRRRIPSNRARLPSPQRRLRRRRAPSMSPFLQSLRFPSCWRLPPTFTRSR